MNHDELLRDYEGLIHYTIFKQFKTNDKNVISRILRQRGSSYEDAFQVAMLEYWKVAREKGYGYHPPYMVTAMRRAIMREIIYTDKQVKDHLSLNYKMYGNGDDASELTYQDTLVDESDHSNIHKLVEDLSFVERIQKLDEKDQQIVLCLINGIISPKEIAERIGLPRTTVQYRKDILVKLLTGRDPVKADRRGKGSKKTRFVDMMKEGHSRERIMDALNLTKMAYYQYRSLYRGEWDV